MEVGLETSWQKGLRKEFDKPYFKDLMQFVHEEYENKVVYPAKEHIFRAFSLTPVERVKVVILGQDPYHGSGQALGLSFAVPKDVTMPPSLLNIRKELESDLGESVARPDLTRWAAQGVLLLNVTLTVRAASPGSHQGKGWEVFTDAVVRFLKEEREHCVFILWGNYARQKGANIDRTKHLVIESAHPSPFSARNGFFGSKPFSRANAYLEEHGEEPIDWL